MEIVAKYANKSLSTFKFLISNVYSYIAIYVSLDNMLGKIIKQLRIYVYFIFCSKYIQYLTGKHNDMRTYNSPYA